MININGRVTCDVCESDRDVRRTTITHNATREEPEWEETIDECLLCIKADMELISWRDDNE